MAQPTQVTTGKVRISYAHLFEPRAISDGAPAKYSVTLLIPKADTNTLARIKTAIAYAKEKWLEKNTGKAAPTKTVVHDGDGVRPSDGEPFGEECKGCYVLTASSSTRPILVYPDKSPLTEPTELYSGCYVKAIINFYAYDVPGNKGIAAGLNGIMKLADGEPLAGTVISDSDWDTDDETEEDDLLG